MTNDKAESQDVHKLVSFDQDPYRSYRGEMISVEYGQTKIVGEYKGLDNFNRMILQPHFRYPESFGTKKAPHIIQDNNPAHITLDGVLNVEHRSKAEINRLIHEIYHHPEDPACLI